MQKSFSILYKIMSSYDYTQEFGVLNITSNYPDLDTILFSGENVFNEFSLLIDENNKIVYSSINNVPSEMLDSLSKYDSNLTKSIIEDSGFFVFCTNINNRSLKYIYAISINRVYDPIYNMVNLWILFFLIIIVTVIILSIFISRIIDEPIRNLNEEIDNNVLKEIDEGRYSEELKLIVNAYNRAVRRIRRLINKINEDWKSNEDIEIIVSDDGMGVDGTIVKSINSELADGVRDEFCGVGMYCVNTKLRLLFGIEYHLVFESTVNKGSKVSFRIPIIKKGDEVV